MKTATKPPKAPKIDRRIGKEPANKEKERNLAVLASIRAGMSTSDVARVFGVSRQRISEIWHDYGDGLNLAQMRQKVVERQAPPSRSYTEREAQKLKARIVREVAQTQTLQVVMERTHTPPNAPHTPDEAA